MELKNISTTQTLDLTGVRFSDGIVFDFTGSSVTSLAPGARVLVVSNLAAFQSRYGTSLNSIIAGQYGVVTSTNLDPKHLSNSGEKVTLVDALGETILSFTYNDSWFKQTDGTGNSLVIRDAGATDRSLWNQREGWFASHTATGSPGSDETPDYAVDAIVVNELLCHRNDAMGDWVEFYNTTGSSINIGGWYLSNDDKDLKKYQIPVGTVIPAYGYKAFNWRDNFGSTANAGCITPFTLGEMGGTVYLTSAASGVLTTFQISQEFSSSDTGVTLGRYIKSTGGKDFVAMATPTYEAANSQPLVGPVVINEIYYNPDTGGNAFIELKNITSQEVKLYDPALPNNTWHLTEGVDFTFPVGAAIPANGYALIVECNPTYFRTKYNISSSVPIYGPYIHTLDKAGDTIELKYPDDPQPDGDVPYDRMDQITYGDSGLWPNTADGDGASLNRISATAYGNDAANWTAGYPTPGANYAAFNPNPITLVTPASASSYTITGTTTYLSVVANDIQGEANVIYDWSVTAMPVGAIYPTFSVNDTNAAKNTTATFYAAGNYTLTVTLADVYGGVITSSVNVTVVQTQTSVGIIPSSVTLLPGASQQFTTAKLDQFGNVMGALDPPVTWSATAGTITASGFYTAPASGTATITATSGSTNLTASVQVVNPVVYWKLEGNGDDSSGNNNTLTLVNSPTYATGQVGSCLSFNGTNQYANSTGSLVDTSQPFSVSAWVNWNGYTGYNTMISEDGVNNSTFFFQKRSGTSFAFVGDNGTGTEAMAMWSTTPTANTWYHLVGVYTGSLLKFYVNGVLVASTAYSIVGAPTGNVIVGAAKYGGNRVDYFHGMIDEAKLFNVALSDVNVAALYNNSLTMPAGWTDADVGAPGIAGNASSSNGTAWTVNGGGTDIGGNLDQCNYVWKTIPAGGSIIAQVSSLTNTNAAAKAGLMIRGSLNSDSMSAGIYVTPSGQTQLVGRGTDGGIATTASVSGDPRWLKLVRQGSNVTAYYSSNGVTWTQLGTPTNVGAGMVFLGMAVTSHDAAQICTASFTNVQINLQPTDIALSAAVVAENQPAGTTVGTFTTTDPDAGNTFTYTLVDGDGSSDNASFTIDAGGILKTAAPLDYETKSSRGIRVRSTDQGGVWMEKVFTINVTDQGEIFSAGQGDWTTGGLTLTLGGDGKLHLYQTGTTTDVVPPHNPANVTGVSITGRDNTDILINNYSGAYNTLLINHVTFKINQDDAISAVTAVTIDDGVLDLNGKTDTISSLLLKSGSVINGTLVASSYTIESGTVTATLAGPGNLQKTTTGQAIAGVVNTSNITVDAGQLTATSIHTGTLTIGAGSTVTITPIASGLLRDLSSQNTSIKPLVADSSQPLSGTTITQAAVTNTASTSSSTDTEGFAAEPLAAGTTIAMLTTMLIEIPTVAMITETDETPTSAQIIVSSDTAVPTSTSVSADSISNANDEVIDLPVIDVVEVASNRPIVESIPARHITKAINPILPQVSIDPRLDSTALHMILETRLDNPLVEKRINNTKTSLFTSLNNELPSSADIVKKHAYTPAITSQRSHIAALDTIVQNLHWNNIDDEVDFDIARHARAINYANQLKNAVDTILSKENDFFLAILYH